MVHNTDEKFLKVLKSTISQNIFKVTVTGQDRLTIHSQSALTAVEIDKLKNVLIEHKRKLSHYLDINRMADGTMVLVAGSIWYQWHKAAKR